MLKKFMISVVSLIIATPGAYANTGYNQYVKVCVDIQKNYTNYKFGTGFSSHDVNDTGYSSQTIQNGESCAEHTYTSGPKSIQVYVAGKVVFGNPLQLITGANCEYMKSFEGPSELNSIYLRTGRAKEYWTFTLIQRQNSATQFDVICRHWGI